MIEQTVRGWNPYIMERRVRLQAARHTLQSDQKGEEMLMEYKILQNLTASNHILFYFKVNDSGFLQLSLSHLRKYVGHRVLNFLWGLKIFTNVIVTITLLQS